jgi:hypothetical protein
MGEIVAVFNSNPDAVTLVTTALSAAGFTVVFALIPDIRNGIVDLDQFISRFDPLVIVYDIGPPYDENWQTLQQLRSTALLRDRRFVLTSINAGRVEEFAGKDERIYEVVGKPYDLGRIARAVKEASRAKATRFGDRAEAAIAARDPEPEPGPSERRYQSERRATWTANEVYRKLRDKRVQVEADRRRGPRRGTDRRAS